MKLSIVVPVFNEEESLGNFITKIESVLKSLTPDYEIIFSMDPCTDRTEKIIKELNRSDKRVKCIKFSRRVGQPMATLAGLNFSTGEAAVVIDADLQDPPELIIEMYKKWQEGFDVVYAQRTARRGENIVKKVVSYVAYKVINKIANVEIPPHTGDFRLMSRRVVNEVVKLKESHGFLRGMVALVGFKQTAVHFERVKRSKGETHYNPLTGSLKIGFNGLFCFSNQMLVLSTIFGFVTAGFSFLTGILYFMLKVTGTPFPMGNPTIVILVLFLGGVQLITIGILGEYIGRIYDEVKCRPKYIVDDTIGFDSNATKNYSAQVDILTTTNI